MKIITLAIALVISLSFGASSASAGELTLKIHDGLVTLVARQVTVREILTEWGRVGQVTVVGADKAPTTPVTLQLTDVPEQKALDTVLRAASGYVVAPRATMVANASRYDRILVMPPSTAPAPTPAAANARPTPAAVQPPVAPAQTQDIEPVEDPTALGNPADAALNPGGAGGAGPGAINPGGPPETQFNYANPQQMMQFRQQTGIGQTPAAAPVAAPSFFPGTATGGVAQPAQQPAATTSSQPGVILQPQQTAPQFRNPYGLPNDAAPGSQAPPQNLEPDRSKYANPYQPTPPPRPPDQ